MGHLVVLGEAVRAEGFALGGATVIHADDPGSVRRAWTSLPDDVAVVILTHRAAAALDGQTIRDDGVLSVVMPP